MKVVVGQVVSGGGHHSRTQATFGDRFAAALGWRPYPGSLNLAIERWPDVGTPDVIVKAGRKKFRMWHATVDGVDVPVVLMSPRWPLKQSRTELVAPVRLRDVVDEGRVVVRLP